jgi:hypothetical protein
MIEQAIILSLIITGLHVAFQPGNVLSPVRVFLANGLDKILDNKWSKYVQKPLWDCLACMSSVWTIVLTWSFDIRVILAVCGLNVIISRLIERDEAMVPVEQVTEYHDDVPTISRQKVR